MKNKDIIYIFVILVIFFYFKNEILNLKKIEKLTNTDNTHSLDKSKVKQMIKEAYNIDIEAIRNLSDVSKELQNGGLTIPGDLTIKGKLTVEKDSVTNGNSNVNGDLVFGGGNNWILHTPDADDPKDRRQTLYVAPSKEYGTTEWDWDKGTDFLNDGGIQVTKFRPKVGRYIDGNNCGTHWNGNVMKKSSKAVLESASANLGDIVPTIYYRGDCNDHFHRGGFMSKSARHDGHIIGTFTDLQDNHAEVLEDWKWK